MALAAHLHRCQNLQKTSEYFLRQYTSGEMNLSRRVSESRLLIAHRLINALTDFTCNGTIITVLVSKFQV